MADILQHDDLLSPAAPAPTPAPAPAPPPIKYRNFHDVDGIRSAVHDNVLEAASTLKPWSNDKHTLKLTNVRYIDGPSTTKQQHKEALLTRQSLTRRMKGTWELYDNATGQLVDKRDQVIGAVPHVTGMGTYLNNGTDYTLQSQPRLDAGVYARRKANGELESFVSIMPGKGVTHRYQFDPAKRVFKIRLQQSEVPIYPLLQALGATPAEMQKAWGSEIFQANAMTNKADVLPKIKARILKKHELLDDSTSTQKLIDTFHRMELNPYVTQRTLGHPHTRMDKDAILAATAKLIAINKGEAEPDDRDNLAYQTFHGPEDLYAERIRKDHGGLQRQAFWKASHSGSLANMPSGLMTKQLNQALIGSGLGLCLEEINPIEILDKHSKITKMGEGGVGSMASIPEECYDDKTEVFTKEGWKPWPTVEANDELACRINGRVEFHKPKRLIKKPYDGELYGIRTRMLDLLVTPNHRHWCRKYRNKPPFATYGFELAREGYRKPRQFQLTSEPWLGENFNSRITLSSVDGARHNYDFARRDFAEFLGWFISEGGIDSYALRVKNIYRITISQDQYEHPENVAAIDALLTRMGIPHSYQGHNFVFGGKQLGTWLREHCGHGSRNMRIPRECFSWSYEDRFALLRSYERGDGSVRSCGSSHYSTNSPQLVKDLVTLACGLGLPAKVGAPDDRCPEKYVTRFRVDVASSVEAGVTSEKLYDTAYYKIGYSGPVYCAEVPGELLLVRRNGSTPTWSGNSRNVQSSHYGFIDRVRTPESSRAGVDLYMARNARKGSDGRIYTTVRNVKTGQDELKSPQDLADAVISFAGELAKPDRFLKTMRRGQLDYSDRKDITHDIPDYENTYSPLANLVPGKSAVKAQRMAMASRMFTQALPLKNAEAPFVRSAVPGSNGTKDFDTEYGHHAGAVFAKKGGTVLREQNGTVSVRYDDGSTEDIELYQHHPLNRKSVTGDTRVWIKRSDCTLWEGKIADYTHNVGDMVQSIDPRTRRSAWLPITGFIAHENDKKLFRVTTGSQRHVDVTEDHSLVTLDGDGNLAPIYPKDCVIGKTRVPIASLPLPEGPTTRSYTLGVLGGLYLSEGHLSETGHSINIAVKPKRRAAYVRKIMRKLGLRPHKPGAGAVIASDKYMHAWLRKRFGRLSGGKFIHPVCFTYGSAFLRGLIAGYFAGDGNLWITKGDALQLTAVSTSLRLIQGLADVVTSFGISVTFFDAPRQFLNENWADAYGFRVTTSHIAKLPQWFAYADRERKLRRYLKPSYRSSPMDVVPVAGTREQRKKFYQSCLAVDPFIHKTARAGYVAKHRIKTAQGVFGDWANSDVTWDVIESIEEIPHQEKVYDFSVAASEVFAVNNGLIVHNTYVHQTSLVQPGMTFAPGQPLARSNFTNDAGTTALGLNARTAYMPWQGLNFEDANVISESMAKRMTSQHIYQHDMEVTDKHKLGKNHFISFFPGKHSKDVLSKLGDDGIIKVGQKVEYGEPLILAAKEKEDTHNKIHRPGSRDYSDTSVLWQHHDPGIVTDVAQSKNGPVVVVKTESPMRVGDKMSGRYGDKGVVSAIIPDDQMPQDPQGRPFEVLLNPAGIPSRTNPMQKPELFLGRIAEITGQPHRVRDFDNIPDMRAYASNLMQQYGLKEQENVLDPVRKRYIPDIPHGSRFFMKLHHTSESKIDARGGGGYSNEETPGAGSKRVSLLDMNALLSHGAIETARDVTLVRGQANPDFWLQFMQGHNPSVNRSPWVYDKFLNSLKAAGVNVVPDGPRLHFMAMTNKDVHNWAGDREIQNGDTARFDKKMEPITGGLFDPKLTGGHGGTNWAKITLPEPMLNPVMEEPARRILGLTQKQLMGVIEGTHELPNHGGTGPGALAKALSAVNIDKELSMARAQIANGTKTARDQAIRKLGYLKSAQKLGIHPSEWMLDAVPVLPPKFRPVSLMGDSGIPLVADANYMYKELIDAKNNYQSMKKLVGEGGATAERAAVYQAFKAVTGLADPVHPKLQEKGIGGILKSVFGSSPKFGTVQRKLLSHPVDNVGRGVIVPNPDLDMDSVGIPEDKAFDVYSRFIARKMRRNGTPLTVALQHIKDRSPLARNILLQEMEERPVYLNRAPVLHKFGIMAFRPKLVAGDAIHISPLIVKGFNADFDGDAMQFHVASTPGSVQEAYDRLLPSRSLISPADFKTPVAMPKNEFVAGLHFASTAKSKRTPRVFATLKDMLVARARGDLSIDDPVEILSQ